MNRERAVGITAILVVAALTYIAITSRSSIEEFRTSRRAGEEIHLKRRPPPGPGLLTESIPFAIPKAKPPVGPRPGPLATTIVRAADDLEPPRYPADSLCGFPQLGAADSTAVLEGYLADRWPRDGSLELFSALRAGDWREVLDLERTYPSRAGGELALLARMNLFSHGADDAAGVGAENLSVDPRDLDAVEEMKMRDPENSFWPLLEAHLRQREGDASDRAELLAEAASKPGYRNPVSSFYSGMKRTALESGDDRAYLAFTTLYSSAPILSSDFMKSLYADAGKSAEGDEMLGWIGKTMEAAQFGGLTSVDSEPRVDGVDGNFMDAWLGRALQRKTKPDAGEARTEYREIRKKFSGDAENAFIDDYVAGKCTDEKAHVYVESLRARLRR